MVLLRRFMPFANMRLFLQNYLKRHKSFLLQIGSAGVLGAASDILTQKIVQKQKWDAKRTGRFFLIGIIFMAPLQYKWLKLLNRIKGSSTFKVGLKRMLIDQTLAAPIFTAYFFVTMGFLEGLGVKKSLEKAQNIVLPVLIWPLAQLINMSIVPLHFRLVFLSTVAFFWNMYISYTNSTASQVKVQ